MSDWSVGLKLCMCSLFVCLMCVSVCVLCCFFSWWSEDEEISWVNISQFRLFPRNSDFFFFYKSEFISRISDFFLPILPMCVCVVLCCFSSWWSEDEDGRFTGVTQTSSSLWRLEQTHAVSFSHTHTHTLFSEPRMCVSLTQSVSVGLDGSLCVCLTSQSVLRTSDTHTHTSEEFYFFLFCRDLLLKYFHMHFYINDSYLRILSIVL